MKFFSLILLTFLVCVIPIFSQDNSESETSESNRKEAQIRLNNARHFEEEKNYSEAYSEIFTAQVLNPNDPEIVLEYQNISNKMNNSLIDPSGQLDVQECLNNARQFENENEYAKAISELTRAITLQANNPRLYLKRASIYTKLKKKGAVFKDIQTALSINSNDIDLLGTAAQELYLNGQYEESIKIGDLAESLDDPRAASNAAWMRYHSEFKLKDYVGTMRDVIKSGNVFSAASDDCILTADSERECLLSRTLKELKNDPQIYNYYNELFVYLDSRIEGPSTMGTIMAIQNLRLVLYSNYALLYEETRTPADTAALFDEYAVKFSLSFRSEIYKKLGKYDKAIKDLTDLINSNSDFSNYQKEAWITQRGDLYVLTKKFDKAISDYELSKTLLTKALGTIDEDFNRRVNDNIAEAKRKQAESVKGIQSSPKPVLHRRY